MENHSSVSRVVFVIQILQIFGGRFNRYFWHVRMKIYRSAKFNMLFQLMLSKIPKRTVFVLTESWSRDQLMQKACIFSGRQLPWYMQIFQKYFFNLCERAEFCKSWNLIGSGRGRFFFINLRSGPNLAPFEHTFLRARKFDFVLISRQQEIPEYKIFPNLWHR